MARMPRIDVPGVAQHVIQRGVDRAVCFCDDLDREFYLACLGEVAGTYQCRLHAYVLMTNHVHLLLTGDKRGSVSAMMQSLGRQYVGRFNSRYRRTGTLWEGRFKSSLVGTERYVLTCYRYIEMNPVRAKMVDRPENYKWSSVHANAYGQWENVIDPHDAYDRLSCDLTERLACYKALLDDAINEDELKSIRAHVNQGKVYAPAKFQNQIRELTGRSVELRLRGRPRKSKNANN